DRRGRRVPALARRGVRDGPRTRRRRWPVHRNAVAARRVAASTTSTARRRNFVAPRARHVPQWRIMRASESPLDLALPARPVAMELVAGRGHYERVLAAVLGAKVSVWIATANVKELMVEDHRARPGRRRSLEKSNY